MMLRPCNTFLSAVRKPAFSYYSILAYDEQGGKIQVRLLEPVLCKRKVLEPQIWV